MGDAPWSSWCILFGANLISVKLFGELEFWFSMVKVTAIIGMIVIGARRPHLRLLRRRRHRRRLQPVGRRRLLPQGHRLARLMTLQGVMFAYLAVELVGVTAGESENPEKTLPKAINTLPWRIAVFYVGALIIILSRREVDRVRARRQPVRRTPSRRSASRRRRRRSSTSSC